MRGADVTAARPAADPAVAPVVAPVAHLLAADPDVPGLALLLDDDALARWLDDRLPPLPGGRPPRRRYVRFKPGAGGVAAVDRGPGHEPLLLAVVSRAAAPKLAKTAVRGAGEVLVHDETDLALLAGPGADRDLPGLVRLRRRGVRSVVDGLDPVDPAARRVLRRCAVAGAPPALLAWKPQRRWVGVLNDAHGGGVGDGDGDGDGEGGARVVLRAYRPASLPRALAGYRAMAGAAPGCVPRVLGVDGDRGLLAVEHLPGTPLDRFLAAGGSAGTGGSGGAGGTAGTAGTEGTDADAALVAAGGLLGRVHAAGGRMTTPAPRPRCEVAGVEQTAALLDLLVPGGGAQALSRRITAALAGLAVEAAVPVHGDLSDDQVLVRASGEVSLLDMDQAGRGPASLDLASVLAAWWSEDPAAAPRRADALARGYAGQRALPDRDAVRVRTAALVLRRAAEPFRHGDPGWPGAVADRLALVAAVLDGRAGV